jgi:hypothetical protein
VYVLTDNKFRWITSLSAENAAKTKQLAEKYLVFPCGLIKGALDVLGVPCSVKAEIMTSVPQCMFILFLHLTLQVLSLLLSSHSKIS